MNTRKQQKYMFYFFHFPSSLPLSALHGAAQGAPNCALVSWTATLPPLPSPDDPENRELDHRTADKLWQKARGLP